MKRTNLFLLTTVFFLAGCGSDSKKSDANTNASQTETGADAGSAGTTTSDAARALPKTLEEALKSKYRTPQNLERDQYRHPLETLKFFDLRPEMTVVEISPGAGWYMEILAPLLATQGQYIAASPPAQNSSYMAEINAKVEAWKKKFPEVALKIKTTTFNPPTDVEIAPEGSADLVLTFRNVHNWVSKGSEKAAFKAFYKALRPGGHLGVVEHRADPKSKKDPKAKSGYVLESEVMRLATEAGFEFDAKSEINSNPKDTKNYPEGVWTLPPTLRMKDVDREKYLAIGESDRMTLRFIKPMKKRK